MTANIDIRTRGVPKNTLGSIKETMSENHGAIDFEDWISSEEKFAFRGILNNIGGASEVLDEEEVKNGVIIASPSKENPKYFFQWTRDSALTIHSLIYAFEESKGSNGKLRDVIEAYMETSYHLQRLPNPSGSFDDEFKSGLGEPKFMTDNTAFNKSWGRPQPDGPGLRVSTIYMYISVLRKFKLGFLSELLKDEKTVYANIVKPDLIYVSHIWDKPAFDLWEEISSSHFFTSMSHLRAINDGINLALKYDSDQSFIDKLYSTYTQLLRFIEVDAGYNSPQNSHIIESPSFVHNGERSSGLDNATVLASLYAHNFEFSDYLEIPFDVNDSKILNTVNALTLDMRKRYPINSKKVNNFKLGVAIGRYPEDVYDGYQKSEGNPWFLCTASIAELFYRFAYKLQTRKLDFAITAENESLFQSFIGSELRVGSLLKHGTPDYNKFLQSNISYADTYLQVVKDHAEGGHLSEQFNKYDGFMQGARDLTWSYSAVWNAIRWRKKTRALFQ
ncbi:Piso0_005540 [Millerozyma farinosa CBS 7064]|uniref:glucan 1,4-alpha-glucosidase n=1 Tax=Pichia sorbitophila (strain ATCC MYA-4447 / BCRC 22081 / CBS 7064 / NBRC 10061 / NRRL Y-12695) TaxID=559304 RepID=G8Y291_PICSO|nr:Piso0_005540 [Millerozyma farinosa CBS 7064]